MEASNRHISESNRRRTKSGGNDRRNLDHFDSANIHPSKSQQKNQVVVSSSSPDGAKAHLSAPLTNVIKIPYQIKAQNIKIFEKPPPDFNGAPQDIKANVKYSPDGLKNMQINGVQQFGANNADEMTVQRNDSRRPDNPTLADVKFNEIGGGVGTEKSAVSVEKYKRLVFEYENLRVDRDSCREQLKIQSQVNDELKKLLVATMGDDLEIKLECLTKDKILLAQDIVKYTAELCDEKEHLERTAIQADVWRSKFLASSLMIDELVSWRYFLIRQFTEAQKSLRNLIDERKEFAKLLYESFIFLNETKNALDVKDAGKYEKFLQSHTITELCECLQDIGRDLHEKMLNSEVVSFRTTFARSSSKKEPMVRSTKAETEALKIVNTDSSLFYSTNPCEEFQKLTDKQAKLLGYPTQCNFKNLTVNCCTKCAGEIKLV